MKKVSIKLLIVSIVLSIVIGFFVSGHFINKYYGRHFLDLALLEMMNEAGIDLAILERLNENEVEEAKSVLEMFIKQNLSISIQYDHSFFNYSRRNDVEELIQRAKQQFTDSLNVPTYSDSILNLKKMWNELER